eukprot:g4940.t1
MLHLLSHKWATRCCVVMWFVLNLSLAPLMKWSYSNTKLCFRKITSDEPPDDRAESAASSGGSSTTEDCRMYDFPIFITGIHMFFCALMTFPFVKVRLTLAEQVRLVSPLALLFAISVGMGNLSLVYVYPSFSQMVSTATPLITMVLHVCLTHARYNRWALVSVPILSGGFLLCYQHERNYHIVGLLCSLLAAVFRGAKSVLQVKTVFAIAASIVVFGNEVAPEQWVGAIICIVGVLLFQRKGKRIDRPPAPADKTKKSN